MSPKPQYLYLHVDIFDHPKILALKSRKLYGAVWAYISGLAYCNRHLTDGFIPNPWAEAICGKKDRDALVELGLWMRVEDDPGPGTDPDPARCGYIVNEFLAYQVSRAEWQNRGERLSQRGRKAAAARWDKEKQRNLRAVPDDIA